MKKFLLLSFFCFASCSQITSKDDDGLRTVPVTNNPHIVPGESQSLTPMQHIR